MAVTVITAGATANGATAAVTVPESRCYTIQVLPQGATVDIEVSVDGTNFFKPSASRFDVNIHASVGYSLVDRPVQKMRIFVSNYTSGTITASVINS